MSKEVKEFKGEAPPISISSSSKTILEKVVNEKAFLQKRNEAFATAFNFRATDDEQFLSFQNVVLLPIWDDFAYILQKLDAELTETEKNAFDQYYAENKDALKSASFADAQTLAELSHLDFEDGSDLDKSFSNAFIYLALSIRLASHLDKDMRPHESIHWANALVICLYLNLKTLTGILLSKKSDAEKKQAKNALNLNSSMFKWFEILLASWGLIITPEGLTYKVEVEPGHTRRNKITAENRKRWKQFTEEKNAACTFANLAQLFSAAQFYDLSPDGKYGFGSWTMADHAYLFFIHSPRLQRRARKTSTRVTCDSKEYDDLLKYIDISRTQQQTDAKLKTAIENWRNL